MNRIFIMLFIIAIVAVIGGALAFKAKGQTVYCGTEKAIAETKDCPEKVNQTFIAGPPFNLYCTIESGTPCIIGVHSLKDLK